MEKKPSLEMPTDTDFEHLRLLSVFHYLLAAIMALASMFPLIHFCMGVLMVAGALDPPDAEADAAMGIFGWFFVVIPALFIFGGLLVSALVALAGRRLARRTDYTFCLVMAAVLCSFFPLGTVLGVFTLLVLTRPGMKASFAW